jgi:hypothetical protein
VPVVLDEEVLTESTSPLVLFDLGGAFTESAPAFPDSEGLLAESLLR